MAHRLLRKPLIYKFSMREQLKLGNAMPLDLSARVKMKGNNKFQTLPLHIIVEKLHDQLMKEAENNDDLSKDISQAGIGNPISKERVKVTISNLLTSNRLYVSDDTLIGKMDAVDSVFAMTCGAGYLEDLRSDNEIEEIQVNGTEIWVVKKGQYPHLIEIEITPANNAMFGGEVEYILYGKDNLATNVKLAKGSIFAIRFIVNSGYALTNSEINSITLPPALAIQAMSSGIIPYKLPQVVMQLALALAESAIDLNKMEAGQKVAIMKSPSTWVLSPNGGMQAVKEFVQKEATDLIKASTDRLTGAMNKLIDNAGNTVEVKTSELIQDVTVAANAKATEAIGYIFNTFTDKLVTSLDQALLHGREEAKTEAQQAKDIIDDALKEASNYINSQPDGVMKTLMNTYYQSQIVPIADDIRADISNAVHNLDQMTAGNLIHQIQERVAGRVEDVLKGLSNKITQEVNAVVKDFGDRIMEKTKGVIDTANKEVTEKVVSLTNDFFDKTFPKTTEKLPSMSGNQAGKNSAISAMLVFGYSDYLKMFMFLGLCVNDVAVVKRIADVIQINIGNGFKDTNPQYLHAKGEDFRMSQAKTYVQVDATIKLDTMFLALPFITEYSGKSADYFVVKYKSAVGY